MGTPYIGEIRMNGYMFAPLGWLACDGSLQNISDYEVLFTLIGTTYGGDGQTTFGLPDLRGRVPIHLGNDGSGNTYTLGQQGGAASVTLATSQMGTHTHAFQGSGSNPNSLGPANAYPANMTGGFYSTDTNPANFTPLSPNSTSVVGGNQPHNNLMPFLCVNFVIATEGVFPTHP